MIVCDIDGTIADNSWRQHLLPKGSGATTQEWDEFNKACGGDKYISRIITIVFQLSGYHQVIFLTGRSEVARAETKEWLDGTYLRYQSLIMRGENDHRKAVEFKREQFLKLGLKKGDIVFEDDPFVIEMLLKDFDCDVFAVNSHCTAVLNKVSQKGD